MITGLYVYEQFQTAYEIIRRDTASNDCEFAVTFPTYEALFDREALIKECDPYIDLYERTTRVLPGHKHLLMNLLNFELIIHINANSQITSLQIKFLPHAEQHIA